MSVKTGGKRRRAGKAGTSKWRGKGEKERESIEWVAVS